MLTDKGKISARQLALMIFPAILATSILSVPSMTMHFAGHDMWLSPVWGAIVGLAVIGISFGLQKLHPGKTIIQASSLIAGWLPGKVIGFLFLTYLPHVTGLIIREYGEFIANNALPRTPLFIVMGTMVLVCAVNVRLGIEVVGRTAQVFVTLLVILLSLIFVLLIGELEPAELLPFMENGLLPSIKGGIAPAAWFSEYIVLAFLLPYIKSEKPPVRTMVLSLLVITASMMITNIFCLFLMGDLTDSFAFPFMIAARYITIADFLQHIEAIIIAIWIFGIFVKISVFLYIFATSAAEWLGLKDYRQLVFPLAFLCVIYSYWIVSDSQSAAGLISTSANVYTMLMLFVLPTAIYVLGLLRKKAGI
ncbi:GerAB/ArcD/ProY family transporter [Paenibacillus sp. YIM B09110]|uniref:GerAB/ArcD/ProY family transporter n=1 Tax=Paenibacillus sp. YIM B09110 TaxID=3126102 RepID=UPI00301C6619